MIDTVAHYPFQQATFIKQGRDKPALFPLI